LSEFILTLNAGSSSIKFALFDAADPPVEHMRGQVDGIGTRPHLAAGVDGEEVADRDVPEVSGHGPALARILELVEERNPDARVPVVGHRIVHGGPDHAAPVVIDAEVERYLHTLEPFAPLHQPHNLAGVAGAREAFPDARQLACFDTAFHRTLPWEAETFALPREYYEKGVRRYGFHGLSYDYVASELARIAPEVARGRVIVAHLGNGASMAALRDGRSQGSTMGLTALDGLPMGTRCGQIDPGVLLYMMETEGKDASEISDILYRRAGLLGLSGLSNDMRALEEAGTEAAEAAISYFTFRIRREAGALASVLGGLDALVFTGGIGEHSERVRREVCAGLGWMGVALDDARNRAPETVISAADSRVGVYVIPTDEEMTIARAAMRLLSGAAG
jgi:acetate kinase